MSPITKEFMPTEDCYDCKYMKSRVLEFLEKNPHMESEVYQVSRNIKEFEKLSEKNLKKAIQSLNRRAIDNFDLEFVNKRPVRAQGN